MSSMYVYVCLCVFWAVGEVEVDGTRYVDLKEDGCRAWNRFTWAGHDQVLVGWAVVLGRCEGACAVRHWIRPTSTGTRSNLGLEHR